MTIPTRWHEPSCKTPEIVVDRNIPKCRTCGGTASTLLQKAAEEPAPSYSGIKLPPERPIGQMDLWWPPCVPYTRDGAPRTRPGASSEDDANLAPQSPHSSLSEIYTSTLGKDQFRLLYLSGSRAVDSPIHGELVEYQRENCPEYETTSYTWGGEDGDATPSKPAYFGDFWDVLFLTKNCWSLLRYLRPHMGTRVVWVDAICINQNNIQERGAQVFSMPQIYRKCMRVVIYAGDHLVRKEEHKFRQTIRHDDIMKHGDIMDDSGLDIRGSILQSRYISRLWIIQELILAPHGILALRDHDLYLSNNFLHCISRKEDGRKWLEFMGQDYELSQTTLYECLRMTIDSQATDPRDRIFGILGILGANPAYSKIVPDYSLSMRDCFIGAMGLTLIKSKEIWPLLHAHTSDTTWGSPSWLPSLDEIATSTGEEDPPRLYDLGMRNWPDEFMKHKLGEQATAIDMGLIVEDATRWNTPRMRLSTSEMPWYQNASIDSSCGALTLQLVRVFDKPQKVLQHTQEMYGDHFLVQGQTAAFWFFSTESPKKPERPCHVFIAFRSRSADSDMRPSRDSSPFGASHACLLLAAEAEASGTFSLLSGFRIDDALLYSAGQPSLPLPSQRPLEGVWRRSERHMLSLFDTLNQTLNYDTRFYELMDLETDADLSEPFGRYMGIAKEAMLFDMIVPGQGSAATGFLQLSLSAARAGEPTTVTEEFRVAYAACLQSAPAEFNAIVEDEHVWFTLVDSDSLSHYWDSLMRNNYEDVPFSDESSLMQTKNAQWWPWNSLFPPWFDLQIPDIGKTGFDGEVCRHYRPEKNEGGAPDRCPLHQDFELQGHMGLNYWLPCATGPRELQMPVRARMPLSKVAKAIRATGLNWYHRYLLAFSEKVSEDVETLLERGPKPEDSNIYLHEWSKPLVDELGFVWRNESVTFV